MSATIAPRFSAIVWMFSLKIATLPRARFRTGVPAMSGPVNSRTVASSLRSRATASSSFAATTSGSLPGRMMLFPPAEMLIRSG
jgi:hypothetical protein